MSILAMTQTLNILQDLIYKKLTFFLVFFILINSGSCFSKDLFGLYDGTLDDDVSQLFIETLTSDLYLNLDSITYIRIPPAPAKIKNIEGKIIKIFKDFAKIIDEKNGAIIIGHNSESIEKMTIILENTSCYFPAVSDTNIIFEDLKQKKCFYFPISKHANLFNLLSKMSIIIRNKNSMSNLELKHAIENIIDNNVPPDLKLHLLKFTNYIIDKSAKIIK